MSLKSHLGSPAVFSIPSPGQFLKCTCKSLIQSCFSATCWSNKHYNIGELQSLMQDQHTAKYLRVCVTSLLLQLIFCSPSSTNRCGLEKFLVFGKISSDILQNCDALFGSETAHCITDRTPLTDACSSNSRLTDKLEMQ